MGYYAIGAVLVAAGAVGIAFVSFSPFDPGQDEIDKVTLFETQIDDQATADLEPEGSAVIVPLRRRYELAFGGGSGGGGGAKETSGQTSGDEGPQNLETEAISPKAADGEPLASKPSYRVIERDTDLEEAGADDALSDKTAPDGRIEPSFDVVRVDPRGGAVIAGRAAPLTDIEIKAGSEVIDRVTSSATGEWVSIPSQPLPAGDQQLSLTAVPEVGAPIDSRQVVLVSIPETVSDTQPVAVVLDKDEGGEGRILQAPDKLQSAGDERLALKLVDYDDEGAIRLSGEAPPGMPVRIYIDNEPAALVIGNSKGDWITTLDQELPGGDYTLRLDQLNRKGQTVARLETPLTRVATPPTEGNAKVDYVVVQPGNSLWRIARRLSGEGFNYVYIFEANQGQIRDPDVIYPGQVFEVPIDVPAEIAG